MKLPSNKPLRLPALAGIAVATAPSAFAQFDGLDLLVLSGS